jgi:SAM-dependent methyltransferase
MDRPDLDPAAHEAALAGLARLNRWARSAGILARPLAESMARAGADSAGRAAARCPLTLLDVACGAGDVPLALAALAQRRGWPLAVRGCDRSGVAVAHALRRAQAAGIAADFVVADALSGPPLPQADLVTCSLFVHHLDEPGAVALLARLAAATRRELLVADLRRTTAGLALAFCAARLLTRSPIVHADGPASVRAAFTPEEALGLARRAGLHGARVERVAPQRWLLRWSVP